VLATAKSTLLPWVCGYPCATRLLSDKIADYYNAELYLLIFFIHFIIHHGDYEARKNEKRRVSEKPWAEYLNINGILLPWNHNDSLRFFKDDDPDPVDPGKWFGTGISGTTTGSAINFTIDLTKDDTKKLKTAGEFLITGDVLVAFTTTNQYIALSKICTHEGNPVLI
jgi:hypothetical protein